MFVRRALLVVGGALLAFLGESVNNVRALPTLRESSAQVPAVDVRLGNLKRVEIDVEPGPVNPPRRPLVLWHGLGDSHSSPGMLEFAELIKGIHEGIFIHSIYVEHDLEADQKAGFFGNIDNQLELVAEQLKGIDELKGGFDALGFSQGGQFLRAYAERYNDPPVHNLITFGSQHMGVADMPLCKPFDFFCRAARSAAHAGVYGAWAQRNLIQAQYFRDPDRLKDYLAHNKFLTSINNEIEESRNETYAVNLASLSNLVLIMFDQDKTVVPKESAWFGSYAPPTDDLADGEQRSSAERPLLDMQSQPLYQEDWIGLRELDEDGRVQLVTCVGEHMQIAADCWEPIVKKYVGATVLEDDMEEWDVCECEDWQDEAGWECVEDEEVEDEEDEDEEAEAEYEHEHEQDEEGFDDGEIYHEGSEEQDGEDDEWVFLDDEGMLSEEFVNERPMDEGWDGADRSVGGQPQLVLL